MNFSPTEAFSLYCGFELLGFMNCEAVKQSPLFGPYLANRSIEDCYAFVVNDLISLPLGHPPHNDAAPGRHWRTFEVSSMYVGLKFVPTLKALKQSDPWATLMEDIAKGILIARFTINHRKDLIIHSQEHNNKIQRKE
ncbi:hypothetical protein L195_g029100 [Trifolium pratense]|uniref:Uncharacterized protein n=1 Tax=Trifolium pratense TaxID=57577 RepID=A0A2K3L3T6_TRIPR|nr:hypothetical protein L195_g029100 [Trifolium pratense]